MISTTNFAKRMKVNYRTALNWLRSGRVPGAVEQKLPNGIIFWEIPVTALTMDRPTRGPKPGKKAAKSRKGAK
jgi:predicted site-specific integrase-resolvase